TQRVRADDSWPEGADEPAMRADACRAALHGLRPSVDAQGHVRGRRPAALVVLREDAVAVARGAGEEQRALTGPARRERAPVPEDVVAVGEGDLVGPHLGRGAVQLEEPAARVVPGIAADLVDERAEGELLDVVVKLAQDAGVLERLQGV